LALGADGDKSKILGAKELQACSPCNARCLAATALLRLSAQGGVTSVGSMHQTTQQSANDALTRLKTRLRSSGRMAYLTENEGGTEPAPLWTQALGLLALSAGRMQGKPHTNHTKTLIRFMIRVRVSFR